MKGLKLKRLLSPFFIYSFINFIAIIITLFNLFDFYEYSILNRNIKLPFIGVTIASLFLAFQLLCLWAFSKLKLKNLNIKIKLNNNIINIIEYTIILISLYGFIKASKDVIFSILSFNDIFLLLGGRLRKYISWGKGYIFISDLIIVPFALSFSKTSKNYLLKRIFTTLILVGEGLIYMSRMRIFIVIISYLLFYLRKNQYKNFINRKFIFKIFYITMIIFAILIISFGARAGAQSFNKENADIYKIAIYNFFDYYSTTIIFTIFGLDLSNSKSINQIQAEAGYNENIMGYTNIGRYYQLFSTYSLFTIIFIVAESYLAIYFWKKFDNGYESGIILYPILFYNLLEGPRLDILSIIDYAIPTLLLIIIILLKNDQKIFMQDKIWNTIQIKKL